MQEETLKDSQVLFDLMRRFWSNFGRHMNNVLEDEGINVPQYMAMISLSGLGETTMSDLSRSLHVTMGASTNIVDKLVRGGYVSRVRDTEDRRVVRVKLEPKGVDAMGIVERRAVTLMSGMLKDVEPERRQQFIESYGRMVTIVEAKETAEALRARVGS